MAEYVFGANILENLTTGMYQDSKIIYREYIQNSCDQIDKAEQLGILRPRDPNKPRDPSGKCPDLGEGVINIQLYPDKRYIIIEDNATGIKADDFQRILGNIADSDKVMGQDKGFRGIGRLCGLAYCKQLVFTSRWAGEDVISIMTCNALKMREMINEANTNVQKHSALDVLNAMARFDIRSATNSDPAHFFKVELIDINEENEELFGGRNEDSIQQLTDYLSFVAPVPYQADFWYRTDIYEYAKSMNIKIDEYDIKINGESIHKKYKTRLKTGNGQDEVYGVKFREFRSNDNSLLAWMWFGETNFIAAIKEEEISRGLRLRKENIQIGEDDTLRGLFTRDRRGNSYFIGEVFAVSPELIPNSQRSYFNENQIRIYFEHELKDYFNNSLHNIYQDGSDINAAIKAINLYTEEAVKFENKAAEGGFWSPEEHEREKANLETKKQKADKGRKTLAKKEENGRSFMSFQITKRRIDEVVSNPQNLEPQVKPATKASIDKVENETVQAPSPYRRKNGFPVDRMFPNLNKGERKLLADKLEQVFTIIEDVADKKTSANIIKRIKEELK